MNNKNYTNQSNVAFDSQYFNKETLYNIQDIMIPGITFSHIETKKNGFNAYIQGDEIEFNDLVLNIIMDEKLEIYKDIVKRIFNMKNGNEESFTASTHIYDNVGNKLFTVNYYNCRIESFGDLDFSTQSQDNVFLSLNIKYEYYDIED